MTEPARIVIWMARVTIASVFATAASAKLRDRQSSREGATELGVPRSLVLPIALLLPIVEMAVAVSVLLQPSRRLGAGIGAILLLMFSLAIVRVLRTGHSPRCFCFGSRRESLAGRSTLVRNATLTVLCLAVALSG